MSFSETIFLFFLALIIFGPKKLPEIARQVGKYLNEFKRASNEFKAQIEQEISHLETQKQEILPPNLTSSSLAGDSHVTEGLAPEGTASRSLTSAKANSDVASGLPAATLAAPLIADSQGQQSPESINGSGEITSPPQRTPVSDSAVDPIDSVKASEAQEFHA